MRARFFISIAAVLLCVSFSVGLAACTQGEDEPCQSDGDCDDGLICTLDDTEIHRGFCQKPGNVDMPPSEMDSGEPPLAPDDAGESIDGSAVPDSGSAAPDTDAG